MSAKLPDNLYARLEPEERFRLGLAAQARGDEFEVARISGASGFKALSVLDRLPFEEAFQQTTLLMFIELFADAVSFAELFERVEQMRIGVDDDVDEQPWLRKARDKAKASAFLLITKFHGWEQFCTGLGTAAFSAWESSRMPGLDRLKGTLKDAERIAFRPTGMLAWLNQLKPEGHPASLPADIKLTPDKIAGDLEELFDSLVEHYGG